MELQREALRKDGCKKVFEDKVSGTRADRPGLAKTLEMLREGDTLVVWKLDRLGRSVKQLVDLVGDLHKHGVQFRSLTDSIDTGTPSGRFFFHVMASLAEMERELTVERTRSLAVSALFGIGLLSGFRACWHVATLPGRSRFQAAVAGPWLVLAAFGALGTVLLLRSPR